MKLVLADKEVTSENAKDDKCHFATNLAAAEEQKAKIGVDNKPAADNNHLVQNVVYDDAVSEQGIDLKTWLQLVILPVLNINSSIMPIMPIHMN